MQRKSAIKWRKNDIKELRRVVKNFNAKVSRLINKYPENRKYYPDKVSYSDLYNQVTTRSDYNNIINRLKRFSRKGSEKIVETKTGAKITSYEKKEASILARSITAKRKKIAESRGVSTSKGTMGSIREMNLLPRKNNLETIKQENLKDYLKTLEKQLLSSYYTESDIRYVENYKEALRNELGIYADRIINILDYISPERVVEEYYNNPFLQIDYVYSPEELERIANTIADEWNAIADYNQ